MTRVEFIRKQIEHIENDLMPALDGLDEQNAAARTNLDVQVAKVAENRAEALISLEILREALAREEAS